jgi:methionyl-tRNA synthetase
MINFEDFSKIDLKIAKVLEVNDHPNADKLYILKVDTGKDQVCQLVAGIKEHYQPQDLEGKSVVVLTNLEPKVVRGVESQGMLLAAQSQDKVVYLTPEAELPPGSKIR